MRLHAQESIAVYPRAQAATELFLHEFGRTRSDHAIHPVTRMAFLGTLELDTLETETPPQPFAQISSAYDEITPEDGGRQLRQLEALADLVDHLVIEECDLTSEAGLRTEIAVPPQSHSSDTFNLVPFLNPALQPPLPGSSPIVVTLRDVDLQQACRPYGQLCHRGGVPAVRGLSGLIHEAVRFEFHGDAVDTSLDDRTACGSVKLLASVMPTRIAGHLMQNPI